MADVRQIIKKMREDGLSAEEAKASLAELGFTNADKLVNEVYGLTTGGKPSAPQAPTPSEKKGEETEKREEAGEEEGEEKGKEEGAGEGVREGEGKELFGGGGKELFGVEEKEEAEVEEKPVEAETEEKIEIPELKITRVEGGEEKEVSIEEMLKNAAEGAGAGAEPALTKTEAASLKAKLDETISLLKALQEINKKILEAEREVLMRLK